MNALTIKEDGVHYTPAVLARFLAREIGKVLDRSERELRILDPACGDGALLDSIRSELGDGRVAKLVGFDKSSVAIDDCQSRLPKSKTELRQENFLQLETSEKKFDVVIANPPFVRTQVLGGKQSQELSKKFGLSGRVDLYQAFTAQIANVLTPSGVLGLITSNRFLTTKSGASMRRLLHGQFSIRSIFDLGDTRLFGAAVLPAIVIAIRKPDPGTVKTRFTRVYSNLLTPSLEETEALFSSIGDGVDDEAKHSKFKIETGYLEFDGRTSSTWSLSNSRNRAWLTTLRASQVHRFDDLAEVKVGIKTTADSVFISESWKSLGDRCPESRLLMPLITHHCADRWAISEPLKQVLYPYDLSSPKRRVVDLKQFPAAGNYLRSHSQRLRGRKYVEKSKREWFEIWVPHQPADWAKPKIVWPDISEMPKFFFDSSGAVVNGDCYWIKLRKDVDSDWLYMMLAVANSTIATEFYDTVFHNKLYANRRRFMTQYVKEFPLPAKDSKIGQQIISCAKKQIESPNLVREQELNSLVEIAFGF